MTKLYHSTMKQKLVYYYCLTALAAIACVQFYGCGLMGDCLNGSGNQVTVSRELQEFSDLNAGGSMKIVLIQNEKSGVRIVADDNVVEHIQTTVSGGTLNIELDKNSCDPGKITIYVSSSAYNDLSFSGASEVSNEGTMELDDLSLRLSGSSEASLLVNASEIETVSSGSSEIAIEGTSKKISVKTSGSSDIVLKGKSDQLSISTSGSSAINGLDLEVNKCRIQTSGNSDVSIHVVNELEVSSSGASDIKYRGNPGRVVHDESGSSSLKKID